MLSAGGKQGNYHDDKMRLRLVGRVGITRQCSASCPASILSSLLRKRIEGMGNQAMGKPKSPTNRGWRCRRLSAVTAIAAAFSVMQTVDSFWQPTLCALRISVRAVGWDDCGGSGVHSEAVPRARFNAKARRRADSQQRALPMAMQRDYDDGPGEIRARCGYSSAAGFVVEILRKSD